MKRIVVLFLCIGIVLCCSSCMLYSYSKDAPKQATTEDAPSIVHTLYAIGDTVTLNEIELTVTDYKFSDLYGDMEEYGQADDGYAYCIVTVDVKNIGNSSANINDYTMQLYYDEEYRYLNEYASEDVFLLYNNESIPALGKLSGKILNFKVPTEVRDTDKPLRLRIGYNSIWLQDEYIEVELR